MPYTTRNGLNIFTTRENGIKYTKKDGSFYVRNANDGKLRLYTRKNKTGAIKKKTLTPSASSSTSRYSSVKSKSRSKSRSKSSSSMKFYSAKSRSKSSSNSSTLFRKNKTQRRRLTRSLRLGKINRQLCGKNRRTNRCRFVRGNERANKQCQLSIKNRCANVPKFNRNKCGRNGKTNRCQFLRRGRRTSKACKMSNGRCVKVSKLKRRK